MKMKTCFSKPLGCCKGNPKREVHSNTGLSSRNKKSPIHNLTLHPIGWKRNSKQSLKPTEEGKK